MFKKNILITLLVFLTISASTYSQDEKLIKSKASLDYVKTELAKFVPVDIKCELGNITQNDREVLKRVIKAAFLIDKLFYKQAYRNNLKLKHELEKLCTKKDKSYLEFFKVMFGSWNRIDKHNPFINRQKRPDGAGYYPEDMTKEEFNTFIKNNPDKADEFTGTFTVIVRENKKLKAVPYHKYYAKTVKKISILLNEAAQITNDPSLKKFLSLRAQDFLTDDYFKSDMAWMDLNGNLEIVIGPYEVYEDKLFGYKGAYESFICVVDKKESKKLDKIGNYLNEMEKHLPIADKYKNFNRGSSCPVKVVQELFTAGDTKAGVQTIAFNLPNDERVRQAKGSKKVMLKNVIRAKFDKILKPIALKILSKEEYQHVTFESYFNRVLLHEVGHGLGPGILKKEDGTETTVGKELKDLYSVIEECKADITSVHNLLYLMEKGVFDKKNKYALFCTYLGGMFRSIRFGIHGAHGGGIAIQFNYLIEKGAFYVGKDNKLHVNTKKIAEAVKELAHKVLMIQAHGDYQKAKKLIEKYSKVTPVLKKYLAQLKDIPVDIRPQYPSIKELGL